MTSLVQLSRRRFLAAAGGVSLPLLGVGTGGVRAAPGPAVIDIGSRRELFLDDFLIERLAGVALLLQQPVPGDVVLACDAPWEGRHCGYFTLFPDGGRFRLYYRGWDYTEKRDPRTCCAESDDGIHWTRPDYGLFDFAGSKANNIVMDGPNELATHNLTPFKDSNPAVDAASRYKAFGRNKQPSGSTLDAFRSPDGLRWERIGDEPVTGKGAYDSQNVAFWDGERGEYRAYWRPRGKGVRVRSIATSVSPDFVHWRPAELLVYEQHVAAEHMYTCTVQAYARAPHLFIGFPTRFELDASVAGKTSNPANAGHTEPIFMSSRDGRRFRRWAEPVIPRTAPQDRGGNRSNYMALGILQLPGRERELSVYASEAGYDRGPARLRRFIYRLDGFVAASGDAQGELLTRPLRFAGRSLELNARTRGGGSIRVELRDEAGRPLPGFTAAESVPLVGDEIAWRPAWRGEPDLASHAGRPIRLRFLLADADLFSLRFNPA